MNRGNGVNTTFAYDPAGRLKSIAHGSVGTDVFEYDAAGQRVTRYFYEPYGQTSSTGPGSYLFQYSGRVPVAGNIYHYRARFYDAVGGRFLSEDPIGILGGTNLYTYAHNSPAQSVDPNGTQQLAKQLWNPWDLKRLTLGPGSFKARGRREYENFGNFHFGIVCAANPWIPWDYCLREAGRGQIDARTSRPEWGDPGSLWNPFGGTRPYGDDPRDQHWMELGKSYYDLLSEKE
jgi:RHS repeat-associated protein